MICSVVPVVNTPVNLTKGTQTPSIKKEPGEKEKVEIKQEKNIASLLTNTPVRSPFLALRHLRNKIRH